MTRYRVRKGIAKNIIFKNIELYIDTRFHDIEVQKGTDSISIKFDEKYILSTSDSIFLNEGLIDFGTYLNTVYIDDIFINEK